MALSLSDTFWKCNWWVSSSTNLINSEAELDEIVKTQISSIQRLRWMRLLKHNSCTCYRIYWSIWSCFKCTQVSISLFLKWEWHRSVLPANMWSEAFLNLLNLCRSRTNGKYILHIYQQTLTIQGLIVEILNLYYILLSYISF